MNPILHETYLRWGRAALDHCKWTFVIGAGNKADDIERTGGWSAEAVQRMRAEGPVASYQEIAERAEEARCGNCGEQAIAAYFYLRRKFGARPLDYMVLNPSRKKGIHAGWVCDGDHAFVLIGRNGGNDAMRQTWDVDAVVCDPWAGVVCAAYDYTKVGVCGFAWHPTKSNLRQP